MRRKSAQIFFILAATSIVIICAVVLYIFKKNPVVPAAAKHSLAETSATSSLERGPGQEQHVYQNSAFHFSLRYPDNLAVKEYKEQGGALSVTFEDAGHGQGFQIYATPYTDTQITQARFALDEPSGVMEQPQDILIDGVRGTMFFGSNPLMGKTREVWFINNGFLYEITTYEVLDSWLGYIMQSWKFI